MPGERGEGKLDVPNRYIEKAEGEEEEEDV